MAVIDVLSADSETFRVYITWSGVLLIKTLAMAFLTVFHRRMTNAMCNPEDCTLGKNFEVKTDETVERVRRAHLNDLENVIPFVIIGFLYILTEPHVVVCCWLIRIVGLSRIAHTIVYAVYPVRQPARAICFYITFVISLYMTLSSIVYFFMI